MAEALSVCGDCGLHHTDPQTADACYRYCVTHHACNLEMTRRSVGRRQPPQATTPGPR